MGWVMPPWLSIPVSFLGGIRASVFFVLLLLALMGAKFWQHKALAVGIQLDTAKAALAVEQADKARILAQLADAARAAKAAKVEAQKAAEAAQKRLEAREAYWRHLYAKDPQARAWGEQDIPPSVLEGLH